MDCVHNDYTTVSLQVQALWSTNLGANGVGQFGPVQIVPGSSQGGFANIAVGPMGDVLVAFQDGLDGSGPANIWVSVQTNAIGTNGVFSTNVFGAAQAVATDAIGGATYIAAESTGIGLNASVGVAWDCDSGGANYDSAYLVYTAMGQEGYLVINFFSSRDGGNTWGGETTLDFGASDANDHFLPSMAVDPLTGLICAFWYDCRNDQGGSSTPLTNTTSRPFTFSNEMITNISIAANLLSGTLLSTNATEAGNNWTVIISGENMNGIQMTNSGTNIYIYGATNTNFIISLGESATNGVNSKVTVIITNIFPDGYTSGSGSDEEAIPYATVSLDGGRTFLPNQALISLNYALNPPAQGIASGVSGSVSLNGWGHHWEQRGPRA